MKDNDLSSMINLIKEVFIIIKKEYKNFLTTEKLELIDNLDINKFIKFINDIEFPPVYLNNFTYYLNTNIKDNLDYSFNSPYISYLKDKNVSEIYLELIPTLCFLILTDEINFLKLGLIQLELQKLSSKYSLNINKVNNYKEVEIASLLNQTVLEDLPFNIIFKDSEIEIFNYLCEEKGIKIAELYYEINKKINLKYKDFSKNNLNLMDFIKYYENINYEDIKDLIYDFINQKIK